MLETQWERVGDETSRLKVEGGHIYRVESGKGLAMVFVPEIDLARYQAHLRDAYNQGFQDGRSEGKLEESELAGEPRHGGCCL